MELKNKDLKYGIIEKIISSNGILSLILCLIVLSFVKLRCKFLKHKIILYETGFGSNFVCKNCGKKYDEK